MTPIDSDSDLFDLTLLPPAQHQFVVISDTHYLLPDNAQAKEWSSIAEFPARTERALQMAGALPADFQVHLGDVSHEYPETGRAQLARAAAREQFGRFGLSFFQAAGNMDIGDKPDPTSPANWASRETLAEWHKEFGPSWQSFDHGELHGIVLNTQIMNGPLSAAEEQQRWVESDLAAHADSRLLLFLHMPIYFVEPEEQALGFYNSLDEPARSWLLDLIDQYNIELVFAGHTHFVSLNRYGDARLYVAPSTATSRAGLAEAYTVRPPDQGRSDIDKLGFYFVRLDLRGSSVHLIRTGRDNPALDTADPRRLVLTRTPGDLPHGRLGLFASHPLGHSTPGPVIWPSIVRQPVRDDWRSLSCLELGANRIRVPASDLDTPSERERLEFLRDEGVAICPYWLWNDRTNFPEVAQTHQEQIDEIEIILPGETIPPDGFSAALQGLQKQEHSLTVSPALPYTTGKYHSRTRVGYLPDELPELESWLENHDLHVDRVACRLYPDGSLWDSAMAIAEVSLNHIRAIDFYLDFDSEDDEHNANIVAEAMVATAIVGGRLVLGPLMDLDRSMDVAHGLLDRLSNPRSAFHVARCLNSILGTNESALSLESNQQEDGARLITAMDNSQRLSLFLPDKDVSNQNFGLDLRPDQSVTIYELANGLSASIDGEDTTRRVHDLISTMSGPYIVSQNVAAS